MVFEVEKYEELLSEIYKIDNGKDQTALSLAFKNLHIYLLESRETIPAKQHQDAQIFLDYFSNTDNNYQAAASQLLAIENNKLVKKDRQFAAFNIENHKISAIKALETALANSIDIGQAINDLEVWLAPIPTGFNQQIVKIAPIAEWQSVLKNLHADDTDKVLKHMQKKQNEPGNYQASNIIKAIEIIEAIELQQAFKGKNFDLARKRLNNLPAEKQKEILLQLSPEVIAEMLNNSYGLGEHFLNLLSSKEPDLSHLHAILNQVNDRIAETIMFNGVQRNCDQLLSNVSTLIKYRQLPAKKIGDITKSAKSNLQEALQEKDPEKIASALKTLDSCLEKEERKVPGYHLFRNQDRSAKITPTDILQDALKDLTKEEKFTLLKHMVSQEYRRPDPELLLNSPAYLDNNKDCYAANKLKTNIIEAVENSFGGFVATHQQILSNDLNGIRSDELDKAYLVTPSRKAAYKNEVAWQVILKLEAEENTLGYDQVVPLAQMNKDYLESKLGKAQVEKLGLDKVLEEVQTDRTSWVTIIAKAILPAKLIAAWNEPPKHIEAEANSAVKQGKVNVLEALPIVQVKVANDIAIDQLSAPVRRASIDIAKQAVDPAPPAKLQVDAERRNSQVEIQR